MTTTGATPITWALRALAGLQAIAIAILAVALLGGDDMAPANAAATAPPAAEVAATPAEATLPFARDEPPPAAAPAAAAPAASTGSGTVLYGRVTNAAGTAIPQGWVWFSRPDETRQVASVSITERDPCFAIAGLSAGELTFRTRADGYQETSGSIVIPPGTPRLRHDIVLQDSWLLAVKIVTPEGTPIRTALVEAAKERRGLYHVEIGAVVTLAQPGGDFPPTALREITFGLGRWRGANDFEMRQSEKKPAKDVAGIVEVDVKQPLWVSAVMRHRVLASVAVEAGQPEATLTVALDTVLKNLGTIRGRVVDAAGKPVSGARVDFGDQQSGGPGDKVGDDGRFEASFLRPGLLTISIQGQRSGWHSLVLLQPGQVLELGDIPVAESRTIKGRCEGLTAKGELSITTQPLDPLPHAALRPGDGHGQVADDGSFTLYLREGRHRVRATRNGGAVVDVDTRTLGDAPLVLQLAPEANIRLDVQSKGEPFELALFDSGNREIWRRDLRDGWKFALPFLPGDYRVELRDGRGRLQTRQLRLGAEGADLRVP